MRCALSLLVCSLALLAQPAARAAEVGDTVLALWAPDRLYFVGTVVEKTDAGYRVVFEDGDQAVVAADNVRRFDLKAGSAVMARWTDKRMYPGKIAKVTGRAFYIHYDDGDKGWVPWGFVAVK